MRQWGHVRMFSPWEYNIDNAAERLLAAAGWNSPDPHQYPTGAELVEHYLEPLATRTPLKDHIRTSSRVTAIGRVGFDKVKTKGREQAPFEIRYQNGAGPKQLRADAVIDASGTWFVAQSGAGANGLPAIGERRRATVSPTAMPDVLGRDRGRYAGKTVAVLGGGHSAIGTLIDLVRLKEEAPRHAGDLAAARRQAGEGVRRRRQRQARRRAASWARPSRGWCGKAGSRSRPGFACRTSAVQRATTAHRRGLGLLRPPRRRRRTDRRDRLPARPSLPARAAAGARSGARMSAGAGAADRSQRAQLRHGAAARRARARAARARLLLRRHEVATAARRPS